MSIPEKALSASIALTRFGLGARPGELSNVGGDPRGFLLAQIGPAGADQPEGVLPGAADSFTLYRNARERAEALKRAAAAAETPAGASLDGALSAATARPGAGPPAAGPLAAGEPAQGRSGVAQAGMTLTGTTREGPALDPAEAERVRLRRAAFDPVRQAEEAEILARMRLGAQTPAGFRERWTLFWSNHFTVSSRKPQAAALAGPFEREAIRPHVFGPFRTLLLAASTHPGMLLYLDQASSVGPNSPAGLRRRAGLNENLGRESLELHTLGADAGYSQADVTEFARALTGWSVARAEDRGGRPGETLWRPQIHEPGQRRIMGRLYQDVGPDQARLVLEDLAADPRTARRLSRKIAAHFVADVPPDRLAARLEAAWRRSDGDLAVVARALVEAPEAFTPAQAKFKTPYDFVLSSYRAAGSAPQSAREALQPLVALGQRPFAAPQPNGWSEEAGDWAAGSALVRRLSWASEFAGRSAPDAPPEAAAADILGARLSPELKLALARAETRSAAFTLLLMSPEFQRR